MNHVLQKTVHVKPDKRGVPAAFVWRGRVYRVAEVQERWRLMGAWWDGDGEHTFFRVRCAGGFYDLSYDHKSRTWTLNIVQD